MSDIEKIDKIIDMKGKPVKATSSEPKAEKNQQAGNLESGAVNIQAQGDVHYYGSPSIEKRTRADQRTRKAKEARKTDTASQGSGDIQTALN